ncbi:MAG: acyl transferase [Cytophagales bacterium]|nr:acyl transferase [Cytophagales bacterium]
MESLETFKKDIFKVTDKVFNQRALQLFKIQCSQNSVYSEFINHLSIKPEEINNVLEIPFLPIELFKSHVVKTGEWAEEQVFKSSGTTKTGRSRHYIRNIDFYHDLSLRIAEDYFGTLNEVNILALLPSYLEQGNSSLVEMMNYFITKGSHESGFHLNSHSQLIEKINSSKQKLMLFGVSYALLDLAETVKIDLSGHIVVDTGGMKGRKKEITRKELHSILKEAFNCDVIHSEYGMTELLSQAYGTEGCLRFPNWCKPFVRDLNDPFDISLEGRGAMNIIDLANVDSCAFVETKDIVDANKNGEFEVLGRMDNSDIRGCSLLL